MASTPTPHGHCVRTHPICDHGFRIYSQALPATSARVRALQIAPEALSYLRCPCSAAGVTNTPCARGRVFAHRVDSTIVETTRQGEYLQD
jgi:hypothetical protein